MGTKITAMSDKELAGVMPRIEARLIELGMSWTELQGATGISSQQLTNWKTRPFPARHLLSVAKALKMSIDELATGEAGVTRRKHYELGDAPLCITRYDVTIKPRTLIDYYEFGALFTIAPWSEMKTHNYRYVIAKRKDGQTVVYETVYDHTETDENQSPVIKFAPLFRGDAVEDRESWYSEDAIAILGGILKPHFDQRLVLM